MKQITLAIFCMATLTSLSCMAQTHNGHEYVDLGLPSGTLWATCNIGATTPEGYGDYFAWGETEPKTTYDWSTYKWCNGLEYTFTKYCTESEMGTIDNKTELELADDAAHANWGGEWRIPSAKDAEELIEKCTWTWVTRNEVSGVEVKGTNGKSIFLPAAGGDIEGETLKPNFAGYYRTSTLITIINDIASNLVFWHSSNLSYFVDDDLDRCYGLSVRPVCKNVSPDTEDESLVSFEAGGIYYNSLGGDSVEVTFKGDSWDAYENEYTGAVVIPTTVAYNGKTYRVTTIGEKAFSYCVGLTSITIPNSVTTIGEYAFENCTNITELTIPINVTLVGDYAFQDMHNLKSVVWNAKQCNNDIRNSLFTVMERTEHGNYINGNPSIKNFTFGNDVEIIPAGICYNLTLQHVTIPSTVTTIGAHAFGFCELLETVNIPMGIKTINDAAFMGCEMLKTIDIPNSVTTIGELAFGLCYSLQSAYLGYGVETIGMGAFHACNQLTKFVCHSPKAVEVGEWYVDEADYILSCTKLDTIIAPAAIFNIPETVWQYLAKDIRYVQISGGKLTTDAFAVINRSFDKLQTLDIAAATNTEISNNAFKGSYKLETLSLPASLQTIGGSAFSGCAKLQKITCLATVPPTIEANTFYEVSREIPVLVPEASLEAYKAAPYWSEFTNIQALAEEVEIVPEENSVTITWAVSADAASYVLTIYADTNHTEEVGTFTFDAQGQLTNSSRKKPAVSCDVNEEDFSYTVTGLDANTTYFYVLNSYDNTNSVIDSKSGQFTTTNTTAINDITLQEDRTSKVFENGTIYIRRNGEKYTVDGIRVM